MYPCPFKQLDFNGRGAEASASWAEEFQLGWRSPKFTMDTFNAGMGHATQVDFFWFSGLNRKQLHIYRSEKEYRLTLFSCVRGNSCEKLCGRMHVPVLVGMMKKTAATLIYER